MITSSCSQKKKYVPSYQSSTLLTPESSYLRATRFECSIRQLFVVSVAYYENTVIPFVYPAPRIPHPAVLVAFLSNSLTARCCLYAFYSTTVGDWRTLIIYCSITPTRFRRFFAHFRFLITAQVRILFVFNAIYFNNKWTRPE